MTCLDAPLDIVQKEHNRPIFDRDASNCRERQALNLKEFTGLSMHVKLLRLGRVKLLKHEDGRTGFEVF